MNGFPTWLERWLLDAVRSFRGQRRPPRRAKRTLLHPETLESRDLPSVLGVSPHHPSPPATPRAEHVTTVNHSGPHLINHAAGVGGSAQGSAREISLRHNVEPRLLDEVARAVAHASVARASSQVAARENTAYRLPPPDGGSTPTTRADRQGLKFNQAEFLRLYQSRRSGFGERLTGQQQAGIRQLLRLIAKDSAVRDVRKVAYMLATVKHEAANTWRAIEEYGCNPRTGCTPIPGNSRNYGDPDPVTGKTYYGRGYVQLTHKSNYARMNRVLRRVYGMHVDIVHHPELVLRPTVAYRIMSYGMRHGSFTGKKLSDFIHRGKPADYYHAREIINGLDRASTIAGYAQKLERILRRSLVR
jgi:putative chitinase